MFGSEYLPDNLFLFQVVEVDCGIPAVNDRILVDVCPIGIATAVSLAHKCGENYGQVTRRCLGSVDYGGTWQLALVRIVSVMDIVNIAAKNAISIN